MSANNFYKFDIPSHHKSIIKVIGVGGGGSNAVNHMFNAGIKDVEFIVCNTDVQALKSSPVPNKLQIGTHLTDGLGAGANPEKGRNAALESREEIRNMLSDNTRMLFITAGMGGGTGTGAAPIIAKLAKELDILTVGIVTMPFMFEGKKKCLQAQEGIDELKSHCDTVLVILNDKLREIYGNLSIREAFSRADNILTTAAKSIAEIITVTSDINVDFEDVQTVMKNAGSAVMGSATTFGDNRARRAAEEAIASPLLNNTDIHGAQKILLSITSGEEPELTMDELREITNYIQEKAGDEADMIFGQGIDASLGANIKVTVIATGFFNETVPTTNPTMPERKVFDLESDKQINLPNSKQPEINKAPINSFTFQKPKEQEKPRAFYPEVKNEPKKEEPKVEYRQERILFQLDEPVANNTIQETQQEEKQEQKIEYFFEVKKESQPVVNNNVLSEEEQKKKFMLEQAQERIKRLKGLSSNIVMNPDEFKEKLEVPAYMRKNVNLQDYPHSSERNISRFNLNDDNEILGNNKFLHDNVD
jgi:cell division protein FtsZ